jgi:hypothetical protein
VHYAPQIGSLVPTGVMCGTPRTCFKIVIVVSSQTWSIFGGLAAMSSVWKRQDAVDQEKSSRVFQSRGT